MSAVRSLLSQRFLWMALLLSLGIGALSVRALWTLRNDEWTYALKANTNLVGTLAHSLEWTLDSVDQSLITVVEGIESAGELSPSARMRDRLREVVRFESVVRLHALGNVVVINAQGDVILDSGSQEPRKANVADRDYFLAFKERGHEGLFVGRPVPSRITGVMSLPLARGFRTPQGEFGGIVLGAVRLSYFNELFASVDLGENSGVNLFRNDGVIVSRFPYGDADVGKSIAGTPNMIRFQQEKEGSFVGRAALDGVERSYSFKHVGRFPLILNVAQAKATIFKKWNRSAGGWGCSPSRSCWRPWRWQCSSHASCSAARR